MYTLPRKNFFYVPKSQKVSKNPDFGKKPTFWLPVHDGTERLGFSSGAKGAKRALFGPKRGFHMPLFGQKGPKAKNPDSPEPKGLT